LAKKNDSESFVRGIRRKIGKQCSAEETVSIVLDGLREERSMRKGSKKLWFRWLERLKTGVSSPGGIPEPPRNTNGPTTKIEAWQTQVMYQRKDAETQRTMVRNEPFLKL